MNDSFIFSLIFVIMLIYAVYRFAKFYWMFWLDGTLLYYSTQPTKDLSSEPFIFTHADKSYKVFVTHEKIDNQMAGTLLSRSNIYINDNLVLMVSRMRCMFLVKRSVDVDLKYINGNIFTILKWSRKYWNDRYDKQNKNGIESIRLIK